MWSEREAYRSCSSRIETAKIREEHCVISTLERCAWTYRSSWAFAWFSCLYAFSCIWRPRRNRSDSCRDKCLIKDAVNLQIYVTWIVVEWSWVWESWLKEPNAGRKPQSQCPLPSRTPHGLAWDRNLSFFSVSTCFPISFLPSFLRASPERNIALAGLYC
jgi:hypothetical protein